MAFSKRRITVDFYELLGVKPDAEPDEIKTAYRKKAKIMHPDAGGDEEEFNALNKAYECLMDPASRAHYDQTGGAPEPETMSPEMRAKVLIADDVGLILAKLQPDILDAGVDLAKTLVGDMEALKAKATRMVADARKKLAMYERVLEEFTGDIFENVLKVQIDITTRNISMMERDIEATTIAIEIASNYKHEFWTPPQIGFSSTTGFVDLSDTA